MRIFEKRIRLQIANFRSQIVVIVSVNLTWIKRTNRRVKSIGNIDCFRKSNAVSFCDGAENFDIQLAVCIDCIIQIQSSRIPWRAEPISCAQTLSCISVVH